MSNELIFLRFYAAEAGAIPAVRPQILSAICSSIEHIYQRAAHLLGAAISIELYFARPPAVGCLEIILQIQSSEAEPSVPHPESKLEKVIKWTAVAGGIATVSGVIWQISFGDQGLVNLLHHKPDLVEISPSGEAARELAADGTLVREVQSILASAASSGAHRVEIELPDGTRTTLFLSGEKVDSRLVARNAYRSNKQQETGTKNGVVRRASADTLNGTWDGKPARLFIGNTDFHPRNGPKSFVVVWLSAKPMPGATEEAQYEGFIATNEDRSRLHVDDEVTEPFQGTNGILVIERAADWS